MRPPVSHELRQHPITTGQLLLSSALLRWVLYQETVKKKQKLPGGFDTLYFSFLNTWSLSKECNVPSSLWRESESWYQDPTLQLLMKKKKIYFENKKKVGLPKDTCLWQTYGSNSSVFLSISDLQTLWACSVTFITHRSSICTQFQYIVFGCNPFGIFFTKNVSQSLSVLHELDIFEKLRELVLDNVWVICTMVIQDSVFDKRA